MFPLDWCSCSLGITSLSLAQFSDSGVIKSTPNSCMTGSPLIFPAIVPRYTMRNIICMSLDRTVQAPYTHTYNQPLTGHDWDQGCAHQQWHPGQGRDARGQPKPWEQRIPESQSWTLWSREAFVEKTMHSELGQSLLNQGSRAGPHWQGLRTIPLPLQLLSDLHNRYPRTVGPEPFTWKTPSFIPK